MLKYSTALFNIYTHKSALEKYNKLYPTRREAINFYYRGTPEASSQNSDAHEKQLCVIESE